jgi:ectoine hydroxylase-related dioxygenase (phytanoyl-CoA dioxygenase family)
VLGPDTSPHLPLDVYHPDKLESVEIPAAKGDVVFFNYQTIHWSDCNRTDAWRKSVRFGYHRTDMRPIGRAENDPHRIDMDNILERKDSIIVQGFRENEGTEVSAYTVPTSAGKKAVK